MQGDEVRKELEEAVGPENVSTESAVLDGYAFQSFGNIDDSIPWIHRPVAVVLPSTVEEVQAVITVPAGVSASSSKPSRRAGEPTRGRAETASSNSTSVA